MGSREEIAALRRSIAEAQLVVLVGSAKAAEFRELSERLEVERDADAMHLVSRRRGLARASPLTVPQPRSMTPPIFANAALAHGSSRIWTTEGFLRLDSFAGLERAAKIAARVGTEARFTAVTREGITEWNAWGECPSWSLSVVMSMLTCHQRTLYYHRAVQAPRQARHPTMLPRSTSRR
jgi:hypothetical protein